MLHLVEIPSLDFCVWFGFRRLRCKHFSATYWSWTSIGGEGQTLFNAQWAEPCSYLDPKGHKIYFYERWPLFQIERCSMETGPSAHRVHTDQHIPHTLVLSCTQRMIYRSQLTDKPAHHWSVGQNWSTWETPQGHRESVQTLYRQHLSLPLTIVPPWSIRGWCSGVEDSGSWWVNSSAPRPWWSQNQL